jgi:hypothetical protein
MRKIVFVVLLSCWALLPFRASLQAATYEPVNDFGDWKQDPWGTGEPVELKPSGSQVVVNATGTGGETWGGLYKHVVGAVGMKATIRVSKVTGDASVGIMDSLGTIAGNRIKAYMCVGRTSAGKNQIYWMVKEKDSVTGQHKQLAGGCFGEFDGEWTTGDNVTVQFKRVGNEIQFSAQGYDSIVRWRPKKKMESLDWSPEIWGWAANGSNNKISARVKKVYIIYP